MQHCSGVATAAAGNADMAEGIVEEGMVDEETIGAETVKDIGYGKTGFLDGSSSIQEAKNSIGLVAESKSSSS